MKIASCKFSINLSIVDSLSSNAIHKLFNMQTFLQCASIPILFKDYKEFERIEAIQKKLLNRWANESKNVFKM